LEDVDTVAEVRLTLPDGSLVLNDGRVVKPREVEQPAVAMSREIKSGRASAVILEKMSRNLHDLPDTPDKMNAMGAVVTYTALGLSDQDIAAALKTSVERIEMLKELDAYKQLVDMLDSTVIDSGKRAANKMLSRAATRATERMIEAVESAREDIAVVASRDVMKAAGVGAATEADRAVSGLNIRIIRKGEHSSDEITVELNNA